MVGGRFGIRALALSSSRAAAEQQGASSERDCSLGGRTGGGCRGEDGARRRATKGRADCCDGRTSSGRAERRSGGWESTAS